MVLEVSPAGRASSARITLTNPADAAFPVEVRAYRGTISETGELQLTPADDDFLIFPTQIAVPARSEQVFRVQYVGDPELRQSQAYYIGVDQVPVTLAKGKTGVQVVVNFNVLVNVVPEGAKPQPVVESVTPAVHDKVPGVEVRVADRGAKYFTASSYDWTLTARATDGTPIQLRQTRDQIAKQIGVGVVAPGRARLFFVPTGKPVAEGSASVTLES